MPSAEDDLLLWIIVQYHLDSLDLLVVRKGPLFTMLCVMCFLFHDIIQGYNEEYWGSDATLANS